MPEDGTEHDGWDEEWAGICEMPAGPESGFDEFAERVRAQMARLGNEVGRTLVIKATVQVHDGELAREEGETDE